MWLRTRGMGPPMSLGSYPAGLVDKTIDVLKLVDEMDVATTLSCALNVLYGVTGSLLVVPLPS
jgi:hypothetical protein